MNHVPKSEMFWGEKRNTRNLWLYRYPIISSVHSFRAVFKITSKILTLQPFILIEKPRLGEHQRSHINRGILTNPQPHTHPGQGKVHQEFYSTIDCQQCLWHHKQVTNKEHILLSHYVNHSIYILFIDRQSIVSANMETRQWRNDWVTRKYWWSPFI